MTTAEAEVEAVSALWLTHMGDPRGLWDAARSLAAALTTDEGKAAIREHLQAWWDAEEDPRDLLEWAFWLAARAGDSSPAHRRATLLTCLCVRTLSGVCPSWFLLDLSLVEFWAWGGRDMRSIAYNAYANRGDRYFGCAERRAWQSLMYTASCAVNVESAFSDARIAIHSAALARDASPSSHNTPHPRDLADLIRAACPVVTT